MNKQVMIEHIATEVMGWRKRDVLCYPAPNREEYWFAGETADPPFPCRVDQFNPFENHQQAFDALGKFDQWCIDHRRVFRRGGRVSIESTTENGIVSFADFPEEGDLLTAICTAICRATGYRDE